MLIEVYYDNSDEVMYSLDPDALKDVDYEACEASFEAKLEAALHSHYPNAEIIVRPGSGQYRVDGEESSDEAITVGEIVHRVWEQFDWVEIV